MLPSLFALIAVLMTMTAGMGGSRTEGELLEALEELLGVLRESEGGEDSEAVLLAEHAADQVSSAPN